MAIVAMIQAIFHLSLCAEIEIAVVATVTKPAT
jgi:hypothetical protein